MKFMKIIKKWNLQLLFKRSSKKKKNLTKFIKKKDFLSLDEDLN